MFRDIAQRQPSWPEPKNNLAVAMLKMGQVEQAQQALEEAVTSQLSFKTAQDNRKRLYDHLAAVAYDKAIGSSEPTRLPALELLTEVKILEQTPKTEVIVENSSQADIVADVSNNIRQRLLGWSRAWSVSDVEQYLAAYSHQFKPSEPGKDYNQWRNIRRARLQLAQNTKVELENIRIYLDEDNQQALAEFVQHYRSASYQDRVVKQLHMALENNQWLILSERVIEQLN